MDEELRLATYEEAPKGAESSSFDGRQWFTYGVGAVVMSANNMDVAVGNLYGSLLYSDVASAVAYGQSFDVTRQACIAAIEALPTHPVYELARDALARARDLYEDRNQIAHGLWDGSPGPVDEVRQVVRYQRHGKIRETEWTQRGLMFLAGALIDCANELNSLAADVRTLRVAGAQHAK
jgi:hypothetical protein